MHDPRKDNILHALILMDVEILFTRAPSYLKRKESVPFLVCIMKSTIAGNNCSIPDRPPGEDSIVWFADFKNNSEQRYRSSTDMTPDIIQIAVKVACRSRFLLRSMDRLRVIRLLFLKYEANMLKNFQYPHSGDKQEI